MNIFDHINISTLKKISENRPSLRIGCCNWMLKYLEGFRNVDVYEFGAWYDYGQFKIATGQLYHDVQNCFYRIEKNGYKIFHATDSAHLSGITAKGYDLYSIEHNYNEETIDGIIREKKERGEFAYNFRAINSHLSEQQAKKFIFENRKETSEVLRIHESSQK